MYPSSEVGTIPVGGLSVADSPGVRHKGPRVLSLTEALSQFVYIGSSLQGRAATERNLERTALDLFFLASATVVRALGPPHTQSGK